MPRAHRYFLPGYVWHITVEEETDETSLLSKRAIDSVTCIDFSKLRSALAFALDYRGMKTSRALELNLIGPRHLTDAVVNVQSQNCVDRPQSFP